MSYQLVTAKIWDGAAWVNASGGTPVGLSYTQTRASSASVTVTASSTVNTYGAWTQLISSLPANTSMLRVWVWGVNVNATNTAAILSIGTGASGSETELFAFGCGGASASFSSSDQGISVIVPVKIVSGTRVVARLAGVRASQTSTVRIMTADADANTFALMPTALDSIGNVLASSRGTYLAASSTWTEITASTTNALRGVSLAVHSATSALTASTAATAGVGVGAAGAETLIGEYSFVSTTAEQVANVTTVYMPYTIPAGSRIAVRQSVATANNIAATVIGVR